MNEDYSKTDFEFSQQDSGDALPESYPSNSADRESSGGLLMESTSKTSWENPTEGPHQAILSEIRDLGMRPTSFGMKRKLRLVWKITDQPGSDGRTIRAF